MESAMTMTAPVTEPAVTVASRLAKAAPGIYPWEISEGRYAGRMGVFVPPTYMARVQAIPGALYSKADTVWTLPKAYPAVLSLSVMAKETGLPIKPHPDLMAWVAQQAQHWQTLRDLSAKVDLKARKAEGDRLYPHQKDDAEWLAYGKGQLPIPARLLLNETGTGKTISVIAGMRRLWIPVGPGPDGEPVSTGKPVLIVAPQKTLKTAWLDDLAEFFPEAKSELIRGTPTQRRKVIERIAAGETQVGIIGWESLKTHTRFEAQPGHALKKCEACGGPTQSPDEAVTEAKCQAHEKELNKIDWGLIVADEVHRAMNNASQTTLALWGLVKRAPNALRWGLTGTPVSRRVEQAWTLLHFADATAWPVKSAWIDYYAESGYNMAGFFETQGFKPNRLDEFQQTFAGVSRRRLKDEVLDLPPLLMGGELRRECFMAKEQATAYAQMRDEMVLRVKEGSLIAQNAMIAAGRLTMLASATGYPDPEAEEKFQAVLDENTQRVEQGLPPKDLPPVEMLLRMPSGKIDQVIEDLASGEFDGEQIALAFESRRLLRLWEAEFAKRHPELHEQLDVIAGDRTHALCDIAVQDFQAGTKRFVAYTYGAGGTGITLTAASTLMRVQRPWSPILWKQGLDRVHRIGSDRHQHVKVIDYVTAHTIEERQLTRHGENALVLESIVQDGPKLLALLGEEDG
jgi:SNF2 family DNA or RNA helicase